MGTYHCFFSEVCDEVSKTKNQCIYVRVFLELVQCHSYLLKWHTCGPGRQIRAVGRSLQRRERPTTPSVIYALTHEEPRVSSWVPNTMLQQAQKNWGAPQHTGGVNALR